MELAAESAARLRKWLDDTQGDPDATLPVDRAEAERLRRLLAEFLPLQAVHLRGLEERLAYARIIYLESPGSPAVRTRQALRAILIDTPAEKTKGPQFDAAKVANDFQAIIETQGTLTLWNSIEAALDLPGFVVANCPLSPRDAIAVVTRRHGFQSQLACIRFLQRERDQREKMLRDDPFALDGVLSALRQLPPEPYRRRRRQRTTTR